MFLRSHFFVKMLQNIIKVRFIQAFDIFLGLPQKLQMTIGIMRYTSISSKQLIVKYMNVHVSKI